MYNYNVVVSLAYVAMAHGYNPPECSGFELLIGASGSMQFPDPAGLYPAGEDRCWKIKSTEWIRLDWTFMEVEDHYKCSNDKPCGSLSTCPYNAGKFCEKDYVQVWDDAANNATICGGQPDVLPSWQPMAKGDVVIRFVSDFSKSYKGFSLSWEQCNGMTEQLMNDPKCYHTYLSTITSSSGTLAFPVSGNYEAGRNTCWRLLCNGQIKLSLTKMDFEVSTPGCLFDFIEVYDSQSIRHRICNVPTLTFSYPPGDLVLRFVSDLCTVATGFSLTYTCSSWNWPAASLPGSLVLRECTAHKQDFSVSSGNFNTVSISTFPLGTTCWRFRCGSQITLAFKSLDLNPGSSDVPCKLQYFIFISHDGVQSERLCGNTLPTYQPPPGDLMLVAYDNIGGTYPGIEFNWVCAAAPLPPPPPDPGLAPTGHLATPLPLTCVKPTDAPLTAIPTAPPTAEPTNAPPTAAPATVEPTAPPTAPPTDSPLTMPPTTAAPLTQPPLTQPPLTQPPLTQPPLTQPPLTQPPLTQPPLTALPTVVPSAQPTSAPLTPVPETTAPEAAFRETPVPTKAPQGLPSEDKINTVGSAAAIGAAMAAGAAAGTATRLVMVSMRCNTNVENEVPRSLHPTQMEIWGSASLGLVVGNFAITFGFGLLCYGLVRLAMSGGAKMFPRLFEGLDTQGWMRFPSAPLVVFQLFYQGTTLGSINLIIHPPFKAAFIFGVVSMCTCMVMPAVIFYCVTNGVPRFAVYVLEGNCSLGRGILLGTGEWVNTLKSRFWVQRYASSMRTFRQDTAWYALIEYTASLAISAIQASETGSYVGCGHKKVFTGVIFFSMLLLEAKLWPHARFRDSALDIVMLGLQGVAMLLMGVGYYKEDLEGNLFSVASHLLLMAVVLLLAKVVVDVCCEVYIAWSGRRTKLQAWLFLDTEMEVDLHKEDFSSDVMSLSLYDSEKARSHKHFILPSTISRNETANVTPLRTPGSSLSGCSNLYGL